MAHIGFEGYEGDAFFHHGHHEALKWYRFIWGFPKIRGTFLGVPRIRTIVYWGLYWGPLILGNFHML